MTQPAVTQQSQAGAVVTDEALRRTLPGRVRIHALQTPDAVAIRHKQLGVWRETTWVGYWERIDAVAHALRNMGVGEGDHVAILSSNRPAWLYADLATQALGARAVGIYDTNPAEDVAYILNHSQARVLVCEDQEQVDKAIEVADETPGLHHVVVVDPRGTRGYTDPRLMTWRALVDKGQRLAAENAGWLEAQIAELDPRTPSMVVYTSGTTGQPKGAMICSQNVVPAADAMVKRLGITRDDQLLSYLPLCHVAEKIFTFFLPLTVGAVVHFGEAIETVQQDLREVSPSVFLGVPRIWEKMHASVSVKMRDASALKRWIFERFTALGQRIAERRLAGQDSLKDRLLWKLGDLLLYRPLQERLGMRNIRYACSGAAPISPELLLWFHGVGIPIAEAYGMTECGGASHVNVPGSIRIGTVGQAIPGLECRTDESGELLMRGDAVFVGYLHNEAATKETIDEAGWLHTGDIGDIDADGYLRITGRKKEIIITSGGKNLSPEKIENAAKNSPYVKEAVAIGDGRKFISALIQIEMDTVGDWATRQGITYTSFEDLSGKPEVHKLIDGELKRCNESLARVEQIRAFRLLPKELHQDDGELTATQKVRRRAVHEKFSGLIDEIYGGGGKA